MNKVIAIIAARGGSKGITDKNIRDVAGKPLIYWQIKNALDSSGIDKVILATDSDKITDITYRLFDEDKLCIYRRDPKISTDTSKTEDTLIAVNKEYPGYDITVLLDTTSPLTKGKDIERCIAKIRDNEWDSVCCAVKDYTFAIDNGYGAFDELIMDRPMRQDIKPRIVECGNCWAMKTDILLKTGNRLGGDKGYVIVDKVSSYTIDTHIDWVIVNHLMEIKHKTYYESRQGIKDFEENYWTEAIDPDGKKRNLTEERYFLLKDRQEELDYINVLPAGKVIDIGCGLGYMLSGIKSEHSKFGIEPSVFASNLARQYGNIHRGTLNNCKWDDGSFDVAIMYHVIEHLDNPISALRKAWKLLKVGGKLIIGTPQFFHDTHDYYGDKYRMLHDKSHISLFNAFGLYDLLNDCMFRVEKVSFPWYKTKFWQGQMAATNGQYNQPAYGNIMTMYCYKK